MKYLYIFMLLSLVQPNLNAFSKAVFKNALGELDIACDSALIGAGVATVASLACEFSGFGSENCYHLGKLVFLVVGVGTYGTSKYKTSQPEQKLS